jgi:hypothetical protein
MPFRDLWKNKGKLYRIRVEVRLRDDKCQGGFSAKFEHGSGIGIARDNPGYYDAIGRWFCREVEAGAILKDGTEELNP